MAGAWQGYMAGHGIGPSAAVRVGERCHPSVGTRHVRNPRREKIAPAAGHNNNKQQGAAASLPYGCTHHHEIDPTQLAFLSPPAPPARPACRRTSALLQYQQYHNTSTSPGYITTTSTHITASLAYQRTPGWLWEWEGKPRVPSLCALVELLRERRKSTHAETAAARARASDQRRLPPPR
eukprot:scaffold14465_cov107-Isochrysis_galbana.AAC.2